MGQDDERMTGSIRILHVDDDATFVEVAGELLERESDRFEVVTATGAGEGMERLAEAEVDCVVSDYEMPGRDGIEFLQSVREAHGAIPFVLYTGKGSEEIASEAISAGVTDYLQKGGGPDQYTVLANRIENAVAQYRAERELDRTERRVRALVEEATDAILVVDEAATITYASGSAESVLGRTPEELVGTSGLDPVHPEDADRVARAFSELVAEPGGHRTVEFRYERPDGSSMWVETRGRKLLDDPAVEGIVVYTADVTERKTRERELERLTSEYETVFANAEDSLFLVDVEGTAEDPEFRIARHNPTHEERSGLTSEEVRGRTHREVLGEETGAAVAANFRRCLEAGETITYEEELTQPAGTRTWETKLTPVTVDGEVTRIVGVSRDVTDQRERQRELERYGELFETVADGIYVLDDDLRFSVVNDAMTGITGHDREALLGTRLSDLVETDSAPAGRSAREALLESDDEVGVVEADLRTADGDVVPCEFRFTVLATEGGTSTVGTVRNVAERQRRERELRRKNERLEEFASALTHDLRNPLEVFTGALALAEETGDPEHFENCRAAVDEMSRLIEDMLTLAREGGAVEDVEPVALAAVAEACWETVDTRGAALVVDTDLVLAADEARLRRFLTNLFRNSVEHSSTGPPPVDEDSVEHGSTGPPPVDEDSVEHGTTEDRSGDGTDAGNGSSGDPGDDGGSTVTVTVGDLDGGFYVADDGPGIDPEVRERAFDPGYSTLDGGTGFGLAIVDDIAGAHGWTVRIAEGDDGGARFEVTGVDELG